MLDSTDLSFLPLCRARRPAAAPGLLLVAWLTSSEGAPGDAALDIVADLLEGRLQDRFIAGRGAVRGGV